MEGTKLHRSMPRSKLNLKSGEITFIITTRNNKTQGKKKKTK